MGSNLGRVGSRVVSPRMAISLALLAGLAYEMRRLDVGIKRERALAFAVRTERGRVDELERLDRSRAELFDIMTHELMQPVAGIRGTAATLAKRWEALDETTRRRMVDTIDKESQRMRVIAEETAALVELEGPGLVIRSKPESVVELAREAADTVGELDGRLRVHLDPGSEEAMVEVDRIRIHQVFRNLISNAEKYSEPGTPIELRVKTTDGRATFSVTNRGPGISPEQIPQLFRFRSNVKPHGMEGTTGSGLGLYICRRIVEGHGGSIHVASDPGAETTFTFTLSTAEAR